MTEHLCLYGPPGTGKTTRLERLAVAAASRVGPERVGAVTFTRAAATELKGRIAASLGIRVPESPSAARSVLERVMPWVGTIHSIAYKLIGRPQMLSGSDLTEFARSMDPGARQIKTASPETVEGYEYDDVSSREVVELALQLHAMARHRRVDLPAAARYLSDRARTEIDVPRLGAIAEAYEGFKRDTGKIDFEDMLEMGGAMDLPVPVLLCDEVQDNSALLWEVLDSWSTSARLAVEAGDPWQAIYVYSGAAPELFRGRTGRWATIGNSHRLSAQTAAFALDLLRRAGYEHDSLLTTWEGVGGDPKDGTKFYLARTNTLLSGIRDRLEEEGTPYRLLRGTGPLQMKAAQAFRAVKKEVENGGLTVGTAALLAESMPPNSGVLPRGKASTWKRLASEDTLTELQEQDRVLAENALEKLPNYDYYQRVLSAHGMAGLILPPKVAVGTVHAAKGREADEVTLVRSWGWLPGRAISSGGRREEACVAYVGATRHRSRFTLLDMPGTGIDYPFPPGIGR